MLPLYPARGMGQSGAWAFQRKKNRGPLCLRTSGTSVSVEDAVPANRDRSRRIPRSAPYPGMRVSRGDQRSGDDFAAVEAVAVSSIGAPQRSATHIYQMVSKNRCASLHALGLPQRAVCVPRSNPAIDFKEPGARARASPRC